MCTASTELPFGLVVRSAASHLRTFPSTLSYFILGVEGVVSDAENDYVCSNHQKSLLRALTLQGLSILRLYYPTIKVNPTNAGSILGAHQFFFRQDFGNWSRHFK